MPVCISELPFTPQALGNAYCWIIYILRGFLWTEALTLEDFLQTDVKSVAKKEEAIRTVVDDFVREGHRAPYEPVHRGVNP